jgi:hypothetical protein
MLSVAVSAQNKHSKVTKYPTYHGLVMAGYQGWFRAEGDGTKSGFSHYFANEAHCGVDAWPDVSEYKNTYTTPFKLADGMTKAPPICILNGCRSMVLMVFLCSALWGMPKIFMHAGKQAW